MSKETIEADKASVLETYRNAKPEEKKMLEKVFGKEKFATSSDWMKLWEKFCKDNKLKVTLPHLNPKDSDEEWDNSCVMLRHIFKIRRGNWKPDYTDGNQAKWFPRFTLSSSGLAFEHSYAILWNSFSFVGSRLCTPTEKMSDSIAKEFLPIFEKFHNLKNL